MLHPSKSHIGQASIRIPASNIAVRADEPALLYRLSGFLGRVPKAYVIVFAILIDRHSLKRVFDNTAQPGVVELVDSHIEIAKEIQRHSERSYRIPYANELDLDLSREHGS